MNALSLLGRYMSASVRAQMQYPASAILMAVGQFVATILDLVAIWVLFARFGAVDGWRFGDVAMFFGLVSISFAIADFLSRGFDVLGTEFIKTGNFDRILLRPRTATLQLIGHDFRFNRAGRLAQGLVVTVIGTTEPRLSLDCADDRARAVDHRGRGRAVLWPDGDPGRARVLDDGESRGDEPADVRRRAGRAVSARPL